MTSSDSEWLAARPQLSQPTSCSELHVYLYELVDRALDAARYAQLEEHITNCPACAEFVAAEARFRELLKQCAYCSAPVTLRERISVQLRITKRLT